MSTARDHAEHQLTRDRRLRLRGKLLPEELLGGRWAEPEWGGRSFRSPCGSTVGIAEVELMKVTITMNE